jgi:hypothetical protein
MSTLALRLSLIVLAGLLAEACSGAATEDESSTNDGDARIATVQSALLQPTGTVSPATVRALATDWQSFEQAIAAFDVLLSVEASTAQVCLIGAATESGLVPDESADGDGGSAPRDGTYDLACVTGGRVSGQLSFQLEPSQSEASDAGVARSLTVQLRSACSRGACVDADAFASIAAQAPLGCEPAVTLAVTATVTVAAASRTFSFGAQGGLGRSALTGVTVYFDDEGRSLTVQSGDSAAPQGPVLVTGANDSFECTLVPAGGRCDGATSFTY